MATYILSDCLSENEIAALPETARHKLEEFLKQKESNVKDSKAAVEKLRVVSDQQCFNLEKQLLENLDKLKTAQADAQTFETKNVKLDTQLKSCNLELEEAKQAADLLKKQLQETKNGSDLLSTEKADLLAMLEKRTRESESLNEEYKAISAQQTLLTTDKFKALAKVDELTCQEGILKQHISRIEHEKDSLLKQVEHLNIEVSQASHRLHTTRSEQGHRLIELEGKLEDVAEQLRLVTSVKESYQKIVEEQNQKLENHSLQVKQLKEQHIKAEEQYQHQLQMQSKLSELYKSSLEESQSRVQELTSAVEEMQTLVREAADDCKSQQQEFTTESAKWQSQLAEKDTLISKLKGDLSKAEHFLEKAQKQVLTEEEVSGLSPSAAAASRLLKSGKSLTEIYAEYVGSLEELQSVRVEKDKLKMYLNEILKEIESKAPTLLKQREDYEKSLKTITLLTEKLNAAIMAHDEMSFELADFKQKFNALQREKEAVERHSRDLSQQVCVLLKEVEVVRGNYLSTEDDDDENNGVVSSSSASGVITDNLVTFKNIQDLQLQNYKLLAVIRDLSEKHERESRENVDRRILDIQTELKGALQEVEALRSARDKQKEMVETIVRQRDMYRELLSQANQNILSSEAQLPAATSTPIATTSPQRNSLDEHSVTLTALHKLQEEYATYKSQSAENTKVLQEQLDFLQNQRMELRLQSAKLTSQLEFLNERYTTLRSTSDGYKKEVAALVARNQQLSAMLAKHEESLNLLRTELMTSHEKLSKSDVMLENVQLEHSLLQQTEARLKAENEMLRREQSGQALLMANLQAIQNNLEKSDSEAKMQFQNRISLLEKELSASRAKLDREVEHGHTICEAFEKERQELQKTLQVEIEKHNKTKDELVSIQGSLHSVRQEALLAEEKLKLLESMIPKESSHSRAIKLARTSGVQSDRDEETSLVLSELQAEVKALKSQLEQSNQHLNQFKSMSSSLEEQLVEQNEINAKLRLDSGKILEEKIATISKLTKELQNLKELNASLVLEGEKKNVSDVSEIDTLRRELVSVRLDLQDAVQRANESKRNEDIARKERLSQATAIQGANDNYQRELMMHANDVKLLESLRSEVAACNAKLATANEAAQKAEFSLKSQKESWDCRELILKEEVERLTSSCMELEKQNRVLHEQMEKMSDQMIGLQTKTAAAVDEAKYSSSEVDGNSNEQLLEIIKYLRKEREIANTKCQVALTESQRFSSKVEFLQTRLDEVNASLSEMQQRDQVNLFTAAQHAELLRKVELLNVLTDGNRLLRKEKKELEDALKELEAKLTKMESEVAPLREKNQELLAQCDVMQAERKALEGEAKRWQMRTHQLTGMRSEKESVQTELGTVKDDLARVSEESRVKDAQVAELQRTMQQVRKIGRKYKTQFDEVKVQYDALVTKHHELEAKTEAKLAEPPAEQVPSLTEAVEAAKQELKKEMDAKLKEAEESVKASDEKVKKLRQTAYQRITVLTSQKEEQSKEIQDLRSKLASYEQTQQTGSVRVEDVKSQFESRIKDLESKVESSEASVKTISQEKVLLEKDMEGMNLKVLVQQKLIETLQAKLKENSNIKLSVGSSSSRESQSNVDSGTPPTANIKPMATTPGATVVRHAHPVNPPSRSTPMGRIRPITAFSQSARMAAVPPTTASSSLSQQLQESSEDSAVPSTSTTVSVPQATVAPTPAVHAVAALVTSSSTVSENLSQQHHVGTFTEPPSSTYEDFDSLAKSADQDVGATPETHLQGAHSSSEPCEASTSSLETTVAPAVLIKRQRIEDSEGTSSDSSPDKVSLKRRRSDTEESVQSPSKAVSQSSSEEVTEAKALATLKGVSIDSCFPQVRLEKLVGYDAELEVIVVESDEELEDTGADVEGIDESEDVYDQDEGAEHDEDRNDVDSRIDVAYEDDDRTTDEYVEDGDAEKLDQEQFQDVSEEVPEDDNDIEILEQGGSMVEEEVLDGGQVVDISRDEPQSLDVRSDDSNLQSAGGEPIEQQPSLVQPLGVPMQRQPYVSRVPPPRASDRVPTFSRQQPVSFPAMGANSGAFEDGDSIVPSTPTLFDPRRNDGFAEAVSSPQVPPERFLFGSSVETPSQLASQALGVDDTRMDLSQLDESSGRSVPSTPLQVSPPGNLDSEVVSDEGPSSMHDVIDSGPLRSDCEDGAGLSESIKEPTETSVEVSGPSVDVVVAAAAAAEVVVVVVPEDSSVAVQGQVSSSTASAVTLAGDHLSVVESPPRIGEISRPGPVGLQQQQQRQPQHYRSPRRGAPIIWERGMPRGGGVASPRGGRGFYPRGQNGSRPYVRRMRVRGHPSQMNVGRQFHHGGGGGGGNRGNRYQQRMP